jgi:AraC family transcriptional activator of pobA
LQTSSSIPNYGLYGDEVQPGAPVFAHIETIATRSSLHDWEILPHRHSGSAQVVIVLKGQVHYLVDRTRSDLRAPCHLVIPAGNVHAFRFDRGTVGYVLTLSAAFAERSTGPDDPMLHLLTHGAAEPIPSAVLPRVERLCDEMLAPGAWHTRQRLLLSLAEPIVRFLAGDEGPRRSVTKRDERLSRFRELAEIHLRDHLPVSHYARALGMTTKTLSRHCRSRLGCTPLEMLHTRLALEAQRLLCFSNGTVAQIAEELGFSDPSYFSRFYLRMTGRRPLHDRASAAHP